MFFLHACTTPQISVYIQLFSDEHEHETDYSPSWHHFGRIEFFGIKSMFHFLFQRQWPLLLITRNNCSHKNLLDNKHGRAVDSIKH